MAIAIAALAVNQMAERRSKVMALSMYIHLFA